MAPTLPLTVHAVKVPAEYRDSPLPERSVRRHRGAVVRPDRSSGRPRLARTGSPSGVVEHHAARGLTLAAVPCLDRRPPNPHRGAELSCETRRLRAPDGATARRRPPALIESLSVGYRCWSGRARAAARSSTVGSSRPVRSVRPGGPGTEQSREAPHQSDRHDDAGNASHMSIVAGGASGRCPIADSRNPGVRVS